MYSFGEKAQEKNKSGKMVDVWILPKYDESKKKAISIIEKYDEINEGDFWILKNETKSGTVMYSGLIISHNACLKINETLKDADKFDPTCVTVDKEGYRDSLVFTYMNAKQGIYEVGEVSPQNCKQAYPYAMALKRCFDRVVLKASKLAYDGIYSESEADTFVRDEKPSETKIEGFTDADDLITTTQAQTIMGMVDETGTDRKKFLKYYRVDQFTDMTKAQYGDALNELAKKKKR